METKDLNLQNSIMGQSRHQFIYGYNGKKREQFLRSMVDKYPVALDKNHPIGIYLDIIGLPKVNSTLELDSIALSTFSREYLSFSIAFNLLEKTLEQIDDINLSERTKQLLNVLNCLSFRNSPTQVHSLLELKNILYDVRNRYYLEYVRYFNTGERRNFVDELPIAFMNLDMFIRYYKEMINSKSFIGIIVDYQDIIALKSQQAVNTLVGSRINADISMKVSCEPNGWETYHDLSGTFVESVHDYGIVEFDDSPKKYIKEIKNKSCFHK